MKKQKQKKKKIAVLSGTNLDKKTMALQSLALSAVVAQSMIFWLYVNTTDPVYLSS